MNRRGLLGLGAAAVALPGMAFTERLRDRRLFDVQAYGARGDGKAKNTDAIQKAINAAYQAGGGVVYLSPGIYLSGGIVLKDNVTLYLEAGATLLSSRDIHDFEPHFGWDRRITDNIRHLIFARDAVNVAVCGAGKIDGQGPLFWKRTKPTPRPEDLGKRRSTPSGRHWMGARVWMYAPRHCWNSSTAGIFTLKALQWKILRAGRCDPLIASQYSSMAFGFGARSMGRIPMAWISLAVGTFSSRIVILRLEMMRFVSKVRIHTVGKSPRPKILLSQIASSPALQTALRWEPLARELLKTSPLPTRWFTTTTCR